MSWQNPQFGIVVLAISVWMGTLAAQLPGQSMSSLLQRQVESQQLEDYLKLLRLNNLVIEHLEIETSREIDGEARQTMAARLVNEYANRMMAGRIPDGPDWQSKAELLLKTYPQLSTTNIRIAILQSTYLREEQAFRTWWDGGRVENQMGKLVENWNDLKKELESLNQQLNADYEDQVAVLQATSENKNIESRRLAQLEGLLLHTDYLIGWSSYFLAVLIPEKTKELMLIADSHFRSFLQIEPKKTLTEVPPEWFDFSSDWNARALVGLAMCQRGLNHPIQSQYCFELIGNHATNPQTRELRFVWDLNSRVYVNEVSAAQEIADSLGEARQLSESGRTAFWMATLNASISTQTRAPVISRRLLRSGLTGLLRQFDAPRIKTFLTDHKISTSGEDFLSLWVAGFLEFHEGATTNNAARYKSAKSKLSAALVCPNETPNAFDLARCRFLLAKIEFQQRNYETASDLFLDCSTKLDKIAPELAAESQWLAVRALAEQSQTRPRYLIRANRAIDQLMRRFPGSTYAKRAEFEKLRINVSALSTDKAIERLKRIEPTDSNYPLVANEVVRIRYRSWLDAHRKRLDAEPESYQALLVATNEYEQLNAASDDSKLKSQLLAIDAMLKTASVEIPSIRLRMDEAEKKADLCQANASLYQEYRYYQFLLAIRSGDQVSASSEAQWLGENAHGTQFEKSAIIRLAQLADQKLKDQEVPTAVEWAEVTAIFEKLVELLGQSEAELKKSPNARVAFARLAALKLESGLVDDSIEMLQFLNRLFPNHKSYLRQLAATYTRSQDYPQATLIWQKLIRGVDPGSDLWLESKYNLAVCLYRDGKLDEARQLHEQTRRLSPGLPAKWEKPFDDLSTLLIEN